MPDPPHRQFAGASWMLAGKEELTMASVQDEWSALLSQPIFSAGFVSRHRDFPKDRRGGLWIPHATAYGAERNTSQWRNPTNPGSSHAGRRAKMESMGVIRKHDIRPLSGIRQRSAIFQRIFAYLCRIFGTIGARRRWGSGRPEPSSGRQYAWKSRVTPLPSALMNSSGIWRVLPATSEMGTSS